MEHGSCEASVSPCHSLGHLPFTPILSSNILEQVSNHLQFTLMDGQCPGCQSGWGLPTDQNISLTLLHSCLNCAPAHFLRHVSLKPQLTPLVKLTGHWGPSCLCLLGTGIIAACHCAQLLTHQARDQASGLQGKRSTDYTMSPVLWQVITSPIKLLIKYSNKHPHAMIINTYERRHIIVSLSNSRLAQASGKAKETGTDFSSKTHF